MAAGLLVLPAALLLAGLASRRGRAKVVPASPPAPAPAPVPASPPIPAATGGYWQQVDPGPSGSFTVPYAALFAVTTPASNPYAPQLAAWLQQQDAAGQTWQLQEFGPGAQLPPDWPAMLDPPALPAYRATGVVAAAPGLTFTPGVPAFPGYYRTFLWSSAGAGAGGHQ
jgi:hypothetical protein